MRRLFAIGEALIDFIPNVTHSKLKDVEQFSRQVGGAPCNVAATVSKLGGKSEMITQLGNDAFGDIIVETIEQLGVGTQYIKRTNKANTALAFVSLQDDGQRDFSFYRKPSADMLYQPENIDDIQIFQDDILHFCSVDLIESDMKNAHEKMIEKFESVGGTIVFDPNVRLPLWEDKLECQRTINAFIPKAHIVKISDEELLFITGKRNEDEAIQSLFRGRVNVVIYTQGAQGATIYTKDDYRIHHEGYQVQAIDT
ncbi:carbohydrate kinase, partial [Ralstonia insidiosa]|nr:carbohydrate kinase [Ralstonia insidiosa]